MPENIDEEYKAAVVRQRSTTRIQIKQILFMWQTPVALLLALLLVWMVQWGLDVSSRNTPSATGSLFRSRVRSNRYSPDINLVPAH